jgi:NitT/TauT family transport system permease protein
MRFLASPAAAPWLVTLGLFLGWEAYCRVTGISPFILPAPSAIFEALWRFRAGIWLNAEQTLLTTLAGFGFAVVFGLFLGVAIGASAWLYAAIYPLLVAFNAIPKVAIVRCW